MPKETFFNLREEKREKIQNAAFAEIAEHGFSGASVTRIVQAAEIATGSFYQYFEDLDDLFMYISIEASNLKAKYMQEEFDKVEDKSLESLIKALYRGGVRFALENFNIQRTANLIKEIKNSELLEKIYQNASQTSIYIWMLPIVQKAIDDGELYEGITMDLLFGLLVNINLAVMDYIASKKRSGEFELNPEDLDKLSELATRIVLYGIRA